MFCNKCGQELSDGALFCFACGNKMEVAADEINNETYNETANVSNNQQNSANYAVEQPNVAVAEEIPQQIPHQVPVDIAETAETEAVEGEMPVEVVPPKKNKWKVPSIVAGILLALVAIGFFVWRPLVYALFPEYYVGGLIESTLDDIVEEIDSIEENMFGFDITMEEKLTAKAKYDIKEDYDDGTSVKVEAVSTNDPDAKELVVTGKVTADGGSGADKGKNEVEYQYYLTDEYIGIGFKSDKDGVIPEGANGKDFVVSSKNFGKDLVSSDIAKKEIPDEWKDGLKKLDLSYSNLLSLAKDDEGRTSDLIDAYKDDFIEFLKKCELSDRKSIDFKMGDDEVSAKEITIEFTPVEAMELAVSLLESTAEDEYINETYGDALVDALDDIIDEIEEELDSDAEYLKEKIEVILIEYGGRIVGVSVYVDDDGVSLFTTDKDYLLNGFEVSADDNGKETTVATFESNWVDEDEEIFINATAGPKKNLKLEAEINFNDGKYETKIKGLTGEALKIKGKCSKGDKFTMTVDKFSIPRRRSEYQYSMEYSEWFDEYYVDSYDSEDAYESYVCSLDSYSSLWKIYWRDPAYRNFMDWYEDKASRYTSDYISYEDWLYEVAYDSYDAETEYKYDVGEWVDIEYDMIINAEYTLSQTAEAKIIKRDKINVFKKTKKELEKIIGIDEFGRGGMVRAVPIVEEATVPEETYYHEDYDYYDEY